MKQPLKIQAICGFGVGSSTLLKIKIQGILKELQVEAEVINGDLPTGPSVPCDAIFCSSDIAENLVGKTKVPVLSVKNIASTPEITEKVKEFLATLE